MKFQNERHLQDFMEAALSSQGFAVSREVSMGGGRVDLATSSHAIECKTTLTRDSINMAAGQLLQYAQDAGDRALVIAGCSPAGSGIQSALSTASRLKASGIQVWFIDQMPEFRHFVQPGGQSDVGSGTPKGTLPQWRAAAVVWALVTVIVLVVAL